VVVEEHPVEADHDPVALGSIGRLAHDQRHERAFVEVGDFAAAAHSRLVVAGGDNRTA
jgi:hypothetical protein